MDRTRNRLKPGDRVRVLGYVHGDHREGDVFEPVATVEHLFPVTRALFTGRKSGGGVAVKFQDGQLGMFDPYVLVHA